MFSEVQRDYVKQLVLANKSNYPYYIAYTNPNITNSYTYDDYDMFIILSKEKITATSLYKYTIPSDSIMYGIRSSNASYNYHQDRLTSLSAPVSLNLNKYVFVYTNAESSAITVQPDILVTSQVSQSHFDGVSVVILIVLLSAVVFKLIKG